MLDNLNGFPDPSGKPVFDVGDEMCRVPLDLVVSGMGVFDNGRFVIFTPSTMGAVFFDPRVEVPAGFPYVGFTAFTRDAVKAGFTAGGESVFVGVKERLELVRG